MKVVIVESPAKAKTINKYLGNEYIVLPSYGHIRDLPSKNGSVDPDQGFSMIWEMDARGVQCVRDITKALKKADVLYLATDPDREGEAISWHVQEKLQEEGALKNIPVHRVVFNQITKDAILRALQTPRDLNQELVQAYLARRALDYLVGFTLSPILWRKLPGSRSAGRVQSVALRLITEREQEIEAFKTQEYWTVQGLFQTPQKKSFIARLTHLRGEKLDKFSLTSEAQAKEAVALVSPHPYQVASVEKKQVKRQPPAPFTTSTLQQESSRKLGFGASRTMQLAQRLYEGVDMEGETVGLITYMRTDSVQVAEEAIHQVRHLIESAYGAPYLPKAPRLYKTKAKNAQEAHEAIRPTDLTRTPDQIRGLLDESQWRLYELVWKRMVASQMANAEFDQVSVDLASQDKTVQWRATGTTQTFDGFLCLYEEGRDDSGSEDEESKLLPPLNQGEKVTPDTITPSQHFTQPPPRYTEASLVKRMEELGIGRPSTYASILQVLQERQYVRLEKKAFTPEERGRIVTSFLTNFFDHYFQYDFTANLESQLDEISGGRLNWQKVLTEFWVSFKAAVEGTKNLKTSEVIDVLEAELAPHLFPPLPEGGDPRACPTCKTGHLNLKLSKYGAFVGCSTYPTCTFTRSLSVDGDAQGQEASSPEDSKPQVLGTDPQEGQEITLRKGPYGWYVQKGEGVGKVKPKRAAIPKTLNPKEIDLSLALNLLSLPREIGMHPEQNLPISMGIGRFGPFIKIGDRFISIRQPDSVLTMTEERALELINTAPAPRKGGAPPRARKALAGKKGPAASPSGSKKTPPKGVSSKAKEKGTKTSPGGRPKKPAS
jgi:DNA topoisomerase-1